MIVSKVIQYYRHKSSHLNFITNQRHQTLLKRYFSLRLMHMLEWLPVLIEQRSLSYDSITVRWWFNIITSWLMLYPHLGKATLDIGTWNELCWTNGSPPIISFERPKSVIGGDQEDRIYKYNKPLQNTNKNKPDLLFLLSQFIKVWCEIRDRKCIFSKQFLYKISLDRSFASNSQQKLWLDSTFYFDQYI